MIEPCWRKLIGALFLLCLLTSKAEGDTGARYTQNFCKAKQCNNVTYTVEAMLESGMALNQAIGNFNTAQIDPQIKDLTSRINTLNLEAAGIRSSEIPEHLKLLIEYSEIKKGLITMRVILRGLARETIKRADLVLRYINKIDEKPKQAARGLKLAAKNFVRLMKNSQKKLEEAKAYLKKVNTRLSTIKANTKILHNKLVAKFEELERNITELSRKKRSISVPQDLDFLELIDEENAEEEDCMQQLISEIQDTDRMLQREYINSNETAEKLQNLRKVQLELKQRLLVETESFLDLGFIPYEFVKTTIDGISSQFKGAFNYHIDY
jgi:hypothetical protein